VAEMNASLQQFLHGYERHNSSWFFSSALPSAGPPGGTNPP
jgi:hypothetical protein